MSNRSRGLHHDGVRIAEYKAVYEDSLFDKGLDAISPGPEVLKHLFSTSFADLIPEQKLWVEFGIAPRVS